MLLKNETQWVENVICGECKSARQLRINRCKQWFNYFVMLIWLLVGVLLSARLFWNDYFGNTQVIAFIGAGIMSIICWRKIIFHFVNESREWFILCSDCGSTQHISPFTSLSEEDQRELVLKMFYGEDKRGE